MVAAPQAAAKDLDWGKPGRFRVLHRCTLRSRPSLSSKVSFCRAQSSHAAATTTGPCTILTSACPQLVGILQSGQLIDTTAVWEDPKTGFRLQCAQGWASLRSSADGRQLLAEVTPGAAQYTEVQVTAAAAERADDSEPGTPLESPSETPTGAGEPARRPGHWIRWARGKSVEWVCCRQASLVWHLHPRMRNSPAAAGRGCRCN